MHIHSYQLYEQIICVEFVIIVVEGSNETTFINVTLTSTITLPCSTLSDVKPIWFINNEMISFSNYKVCIISNLRYINM